MVEQFLSKVFDPDCARAIAGWKEVRRQSDKLRTINHKQLQTLIGAAERAHDPDVFRHAAAALFQIIDARRESVASTNAATPVVDWLWQPFRQSSLVLTTAQRDEPRPDEAAEFFVGRLLHRERCPKLRLIHFPSGEDAMWQQEVSDRRCKAVCVLGRLGLFGADAVDALGNRNPRFRILPLPDVRPSASGDAALREYYVVESAGPGQLDEYFPAQSPLQRTDYAIVERYRVLLGGRSVAVVRCAGCSSLGTLAAAQWACEELSDSASYRMPHPILLPKGTTDTSQLHALIHVTASQSRSHWEPKRLDVKKLFIDNWSWDAEEENWNLLPVQEIVLVQRPGQPARFLFDGCSVNTRADSDAFQLLVALVEGKVRCGSCRLDRTRLAKTLGCTQKELGKQLSLLKCRRLHDALQVEDATVTLHAKTRVVDESKLDKPRKPR